VPLLRDNALDDVEKLFVTQDTCAITRTYRRSIGIRTAEIARADLTVLKGCRTGGADGSRRMTSSCGAVAVLEATGRLEGPLAIAELVLGPPHVLSARSETRALEP